jgi:hypothetical protein
MININERFSPLLKVVRVETGTAEKGDLTMTTNKRTRWTLALAAVAAMGALFVSDNLSPNANSTFLSQAEARVGRPLTPMSYAGVARRTTRRAVAAGAVYGAGRYYGGACGYYPYPAC